MADVTVPVADPGSFVCAGDWHGSLRAASAAVMSAAARGVPVVVQVGDFGLWSGPDGEAFLDGVSKVAVRGGVQVLWLDGNHEDFDLLETFPVDASTGLRPVRDNVTHVPRGSRWEWSGLRFAAVGGATSLDVARRTPGRSWWAQEALTARQAEEVVAGGGCDVLLCHDCPEGVPIPGIDRASALRRWPESALRAAWAHRELLAAVAAELGPTHVFHGHFHVRYTATVDLWGARATVVQGLGDDSGVGDGSNRVLVRLDALAAQSEELTAAGGGR